MLKAYSIFCITSLDYTLLIFQRDFFTKTWGENFVEIREIPPHVALPQVSSKHVESYVRRLQKRQKLLSRLASMQAGKAQEAAEESSLEPSPRGKVEF